jgi:uncharacterized membrane protein YraQ (UPF0718 family)
MINYKDNKSLFFLFFIIFIYIIIFITNSNNFFLIIKKVILILTNIYYVFIIIFILMIISYYFIKPKQISRYLGEKSGIAGWIISIIGGIISTGPIYMWYPLLKDLKKQGARDAYIATFLYNRSIKIPILPIIILYFGIKYTIILMIVMIVFSVIQGIIVEKIIKKNEVLL